MPPAPSAAKMAAENAIDLSAVAGSGKRGQVLKGDVIDTLAKPQPAPVAPAPVAPPPAARLPSRRCARPPRPTTPRARSACG